MLGVFLHLDILHFLRQGLSLNLELSDWQGWLASEHQRFSSLRSPSTGDTVTHWSFGEVAGDLNSGLHSCATGAL